MREILSQRLQGPYRALGQLDAHLYEVDKRLAELREEMNGVHSLLAGEMRAGLRALVAEESANRRRLEELRAAPDYRAAWTEERPLVSITVTTYNRPELLRTRCLPSILGQSYEELEVIVVGDAAGPETEAAVRELADPRVSFFDLPHRLRLSEDPVRFWRVAATMPRNEANRRAQGRWLLQFDDDDALRPDCIERLLERARENEVEVAYGRVQALRENEPPIEVGGFPPQLGQFTWAAGIHHAGLRFLHRELHAADLEVPGDWYLAERMLRIGVRFGMVDAVLADIYPSPLNRVGEPPA